MSALSQDRRLTHVYEITGDFDVLVIGRFRNESEMNTEIKRMLSLPGIEGTSTSIVLSAAKDGLAAPGGLEVRQESGRVRVAAGGVLLEAALRDRLEVAVDARVPVTERGPGQGMSPGSARSPLWHAPSRSAGPARDW